MSPQEFTTLMCYISSDLIEYISLQQNISCEEAMIKLYSSKLYEYLEQEEMKVWHYSTPMLYSLLEQEEKTGTIQFPDV